MSCSLSPPLRLTASGSSPKSKPLGGFITQTLYFGLICNFCARVLVILDSFHSMRRFVILTFYITKGDIAPMPRIANRVAHQEPSVFGEINEIAAQYPDTINLGQGRPDFDGPKEIMQAAADAILTGKANQYAPDLGVKALRESIALHAQSQYNLDINQ